MRVLFASANYGEQIVGGAQLSVRLVAEQLVGMGHEVGVVCIDPTLEPRTTSAANVQIFRLPARNLYWHRSPRPDPLQRVAWHGVDRFAATLSEPFRRVLSEFRPDVVHTNVLSGLTTSIWNVADELSLPSVHTVHDYYLLCANSGMRRKDENCASPCLQCKLFSAPSRRAAKLVSAVVYVSEHMRATHEREAVFARDAHVAEIIGSYAPAEPATPRVDRSGPLTLGFLGRLAPDKGLERLLSELQRLDGSKVRLHIGGVGAPAYEAKLKQAARGLPVDFLGRVEPQAFFQSIDALVVPSLWNEPAGRVVFEAGLSRVPVIVSRRGGLPQMVGFGRLGWTYEPDQPGALASLVERLASAPAEAAEKVSAWTELEQAFAPARVAQRTLDVYHRAIEVHHERRVHASQRAYGRSVTRTD